MANSAYDTVVLASNPIRYYKCDDAIGQPILDYGSQAQNGTQSGTVKRVPGLLASEVSGVAFSFPGDASAYVDLPATGLPTGASAWTMECWFWFSFRDINFPSLMAFGSAGTNQTAAIYVNNDGTVHAGFQAAGDIGTTTAPTLGVGHHIMSTYDGTTLKLYLDGQAQGSGAATTGGIVAGKAALGILSDEVTLPYQGILAKAAFYNTALAAAAVLAHYKAGIAPPTSRMITSGRAGVLVGQFYQGSIGG